MSRTILVLEPFGDGSHATFYRGWQRFSRHRFKILALPAVHWKWRSRHSSLTLAQEAKEWLRGGERCELIFCSDMLNLPEWRGLAGRPLASTPTIAYFHENQFTYPLRPGEQRDYHYAYSNLLTAVAADEIWFNSEFHRQEFAAGATAWLRRMLDFQHRPLFAEAIAAARICPPGILPPNSVLDRATATPADRHASASPLRIGWVARWEHDKGPERFAAVVDGLLARELPFQLILLGQQFRQKHPALEHIERIAGPQLLHVGYAPSAEAYWQWLSKIDVVVSTADHEFFGVGIVEAVAAGAFPLLPRGLAYPEVFQIGEFPQREIACYRGGTDELIERLASHIAATPPGLSGQAEFRQRALEFHWSQLAKRYDTLVDQLLEGLAG